MNHRVSANPVTVCFDVPHVATVTVRKAGVRRRIVKVVYEREATPRKVELYRFYQRNVEQTPDKAGLDASLRYCVRHRLWEAEPPDESD